MKIESSKEALRYLSIVVWILFVLLMGLTYYVNHYMPHGPMYDTGDVVCQNDDRGPCAEQYKEDMHALNIPYWVKLLREDFILLFIGLPILALYLDAKSKGQVDT